MNRGSGRLKKSAWWTMNMVAKQSSLSSGKSPYHFVENRKHRRLLIPTAASQVSQKLPHLQFRPPPNLILVLTPADSQISDDGNRKTLSFASRGRKSRICGHVSRVPGGDEVSRQTIATTTRHKTGDNRQRAVNDLQPVHRLPADSSLPAASHAFVRAPPIAKLATTRPLVKKRLRLC